MSLSWSIEGMKQNLFSGYGGILFAGFVEI